jgi:hypothetical protein
MKTIRRFSNVAQAGFARSVLEAAGIDATLADEHAFTLGPQYAPWGIRLQVPDGDVERAERVLDQQEGFLPLPHDFVPPPEAPETTAAPTQSTPSAAGAFLRGGLWGLAVFGVLAVISVLAGGQTHADLGGLVLLFAIGGIIGIVVRAIYNKGRRDESATDSGG